MKKITWADFAVFNPCYNPSERYGEWSGTMLDLLNREDIPAEDRIWAFCTGVAWDGEDCEKNLRLFACSCVRKVWHLAEDERSKNAVYFAEKYASGEATKQELAAAWAAARAAALAAAKAAAMAAAKAAAWAAAKAAAKAAAMDAARDAAWAAAMDAAWAAAMDAARDAASDAARDAASDAARDGQIEIAKTFI